MYDSLLTLIKESIKKKENLHIHQKERGLGLTTLFKKIEGLHLGVYVEAGPPKGVLQSIVRQRGTIYELKRKVNPNKLTILLDNVQDLNTKSYNLFNSWLRQGLVLITGGTKNLFGFNEVVLAPLSFEDSLNFLKKFIKNEELAKIIAKECKGNISKMMRCINVSKNVNYKTEEGLQAIKNSIKFKRSFNFSPSVLYPIVQTLRYFLYARRNYQLGNSFAFLAYLLMFLRFVRKK